MNMSQDVEQYIRSIVVSLRNHSLVASGASPKATAALNSIVKYCRLKQLQFTYSRVVALFAGQKFVTPSHVLSIASAVLRHRITLKQSTQASTLEVVNSVLESEIPPV